MIPTTTPVPDRPPWTAPPGAGATPAAGRFVPAALALAAAAALELLALVPHQGPGEVPLGQQASSVSTQIVLAAGYLTAALLAVLPARGRVVHAAALAAGITLAGAGLVAADLADVLAVGSPGATEGLLVGAWAAGAAGAVLAFDAARGRGPGRRDLGGRDFGRPARSRRRDDISVLTFATGLLLAVALLPAWDHYELSFVGGFRTLDRGSVFDRSVPAMVTFGNLLAALAFVVVPVVAARWRPARVAVAATGGVLVVVVGQLLNAFVQLSETTVGQFVSSAAEARALGLTVRPSLTVWYDLEVLAALVLVVLVAVRWATPEPSTDTPAGTARSPIVEGTTRPARWPPPAGPVPGGPAPHGTTGRP